MDISNIIYRKYTLTTDKNPEEVLQIISDNITEKSFFFGNGTKDPFYGNIDNEKRTFSIYKRYTGRNIFTAILVGEIQPNTLGSVIDLKIRLPWFTILFSIFFIGNIIRMLALAAMDKVHNALIGLFFFSAFTFIIFLICWSMYQYGAKSSLETLTKLLQAKITPTTSQKAGQNQGRFNR